jgi:hypothetical protein
MVWRMSEKEAIERGLIEGPKPDQEVLDYVNRQRYNGLQWSPQIQGMLIMAWAVGLAMGFVLGSLLYGRV